MVFGDFLRRLLSTQDERGRKTSDWFRMSVRRAVRSMVSGDAGSVLDAGGGDGLLFDPNISGLAGVTTILDLDVKALHEARQRYSGRGMFVSGDITRMPFPDVIFDTAVCIGTFYNFPTSELVRQGILEMARVTGNDGRVIVEFRNADNPVVYLAYKYAEKYDPSLKGLPLNAYSIEHVKNMLAHAGLIPKSIKYIGIPFRYLAIGFILEAVHNKNKGE